MGIVHSRRFRLRRAHVGMLAIVAETHSGAEIEEAIIIIGITRSGSLAAKGIAPSVMCVQPRI
jgi:PTS system fructose-specific IIC component